MNAAEFLDPAHWLRREGGPRYVQLRNRLVDGIGQGILAPGQPLPPEREIAVITTLSRVTVRRAIRSLAGDGAIVQKQGSGSFVAPNPAPIDTSQARLTSFTEDMALQGRKAHSRWLERGLFMPSHDETAALGLGPDDSVARIGRLRLADGAPVAIERASLPSDILANPLAVETSLYAALECLGVRPVHARQKISAVSIAGPDAGLLDVTPGSAGLRLVRLAYLADGRVAEYTQSLYRGDACNFIAELRLAKD